VAGEPNKSLEVAAALQRLADLARQQGLAPHNLAAALAPDAPASEFAAAFADFLARYGHRSFSLDIVQPPFAADPAQVLPLIGSNDFPETGAASASRFGAPLCPQPTTEVVTTSPQPTTEVVTTGGWDLRLHEHHRQEPKKRDEDNTGYPHL